MTPVKLLQYVNDALFVALAAVCLIRWLRQGGRAVAWLALTFGSLAAVVLVGLVLQATGTEQPPLWAIRFLLALLVLFPFLLFRFSAALEPPGRPTELVAVALTGGVVVWTLLLPEFPAEGAPRGAAFSAYVAALAFDWSVLSLIVAWRLWRAGRRQPSAARRRMRRLSLGATGLSLTIVLGVFTPPDHSGPIAALAPLLTLASALLLFLAFSPQGLTGRPERSPEQRILRDAMNELMGVTRVEEVAGCLLPRVVALVAAKGAALLDSGGRVLGAEGSTPGVGEGGAPAKDVDAPVRLPFGHGALLVWTGPYAPVFAGRELDLLQALCTLTELAMERVDAVERDAQLAAVVDASGDAIVSVDLDGLVRSWNPGAEATYGRQAGEVVGRPLAVVAPPDRQADLAGLLHRAGRERVELETVHLRPDGSAIDVALSAAPLRDRAGRVSGVSVVARDVTDRKQAERALEEARDAADQANQAKSEFLSRMSHELRTPLNAILGFAQLLEMDALAEDQRESLRYIVSGGRHLLDLINEVLDIAAIEAGRLTLSVEPVAVADLAGEVVDLIRPLADQRSIQLSSSAQARGEHVKADRQRLKQILLNLLSNAVKYNHEGGSVSLGCSLVDGQRLRVEVSDTGPGIAPDSLARLFVPFERLEAGLGEVEGTGLGLALSRRLAEAMGGTLEVATVLGKGSTFWVELPVATHPVDEAAPDARLGRAAAPAGAPGEPLTVLYIEDNTSNMELVERIMQRRGVRLIPAMRPLLGLDLAIQHQPDLILLDLHLPDLPGEEVLGRLRANPRTASIPVVILSADARPGHIRRLIELGAREFLTKPLEVDHLLRLLDELLDERQRAGQPAVSG